MTDLYTNRVTLRQWQLTDLEPFRQLNSDPVVMEHFPEALSNEASDLLAERCRTHIDKAGWGLWAAEEKTSRKFMGFVGLLEVPDFMPFAPAVEIGWRLHHLFWGNGYATEAALEVLDFAFDELQLDRVVSFTASSNLRSIAVMKRLGMADAHKKFLHPKIDPEHDLAEHVLFTLSRSNRRVLET